MLNNIFPLFERGRIMKKEMLWAVRDYAYDYGRLMAQNRGNGVLTGCSLSVEEGNIVLGTGIIKFNSFLYLVGRPLQIPYSHSEVYVSLKLCFSPAQEMADFIRYDAEPIISDRLELSENELELCRFKLKRGFRLRNDYNSFEDIQTEFDTMNLADATWSAECGGGLSPFITSYFARGALRCPLTNSWDISFCHHCLRDALAVNPLLVRAYAADRLGVDNQVYSNRQLFEYLAMILQNIQNKTDIRPERQQRRKREIWVD